MGTCGNVRTTCQLYVHSFVIIGTTCQIYVFSTAKRVLVFWDSHNALTQIGVTVHAMHSSESVCIGAMACAVHMCTLLLTPVLPASPPLSSDSVYGSLKQREFARVCTVHGRSDMFVPRTAALSRCLIIIICVFSVSMLCGNIPMVRKVCCGVPTQLHVACSFTVALAWLTTRKTEPLNCPLHSTTQESPSHNHDDHDQAAWGCMLLLDLQLLTHAHGFWASGLAMAPTPMPLLCPCNTNLYLHIQCAACGWLRGVRVPWLLLAVLPALLSLSL